VRGNRCTAPEAPPATSAATARKDFDKRALRAWLTARVQQVRADTLTQIGERLSRLGYWEFEDCRTYGQ
jgi:hypothetical protein